MQDEVIIDEHKKQKEESIKFKERRFEQWNQNYYFFRDKIIANRLTQRQSVNLPLVRETIQTWISKIDEPPILKFESRGKSNGDKNGEIVLNELWAYHFDKLQLDVLDNVEKKVVGLQGRSFKKWGFSNGEIFCDLIDPFDIDIDPRTNPLDLETANWIIHKNIFRPLRKLLANPKYSAEAKNKLKLYLDSKNGLIQSATSREEFEERNQRLLTLGVSNFDDFRASDVLVDINEGYKLVWNDKENRFVRHLQIIACDSIVLYNKPIKDATGINILPIVSWASDPDMNDLWSDGIADSVRTINKVVNMYISQDLENRTYRNFGMRFFNTMNGQFTPRALEAKPFGMYGVPGNPNEIIQEMNIQPLNDTAQQITFLKDLIQSSVAQTPTERGVNAGDTNQTLGEVQLQFQQSQGRNEVVAKNYRNAWKKSGQIFYELLNANSSGSMKLYKKGNDNNYHMKEIRPTDWQNPQGYECKVVLKSESDKVDDLNLKKLQYVKASFQTNPVALKLAKRKELELLEWTDDEIEQVMQFEDQQMASPMQIQDAQTMPEEQLPVAEPTNVE
jgi:hypothetical protein